MQELLRRVSMFGYKRPWRVISIWLVILAMLGGVAYLNFKEPTTAISIPGTEADRALTKMRTLFPEAGTGTARVVFETPNEEAIARYQETITTLTSDVKKVQGVKDAIDYTVNASALSSKGYIAYTQVLLKDGFGDVNEKTRSGILSAVEKARKSGLKVEVGGDVANPAPKDILGVGEFAGLAIALIVLLLVFGSVVSAGLPLIVAVLAVGVSMAGLFALGRVVEISSTTPVLAVMLGLAVGIDYSLFVLNKYRHYLLEGAQGEVAIRRALTTAGSAVVFAAATVVIALSALAIVNIPFMTTMGLAGAATIVVAALVSLTTIPAFARLSGRNLFRGKTKRMIIEAQERGFEHTTVAGKQRIWYRIGERITRHPRVFAALSIALFAVLSVPGLSLKLDIPSQQYSSPTLSERRAYDTIAKGFGAGYNAPIAVVVEGLKPVTDVERQKVRTELMDKFTKAVQSEEAAQKERFMKKASEVQAPEQYMALQQEIAQAQTEGEKRKQGALKQIDRGTNEIAKRLHLDAIGKKIADLSDVKLAQAGLATSDGTSGVIQIIPSTAPNEDGTKQLIARIRDPEEQKKWSNESVSYYVTGTTAVQADVNARLMKALPLYLSVVVGLSFILLIVAFRSILIPLKATIGYLLSVGVMFGALVAVFQWGWFGIAEVPAPIMTFIPIIAIGILFGLAMDYEFFLVSSMHESYEAGEEPRQAVRDGFGMGAKVVTAAAVIMVAVFGSFITNHDATIRAIGFALAVGILFDAFIVRMVLTPAIMTLLGKSAWWMPQWLARITPKVSLEGKDEG